MNVHADWGIVTKFPDDSADYRLLAICQKDGDDIQFHSLIRKWMVGEMPYESSQSEPGAPWYIFGIITNPLRQVVIEQKWTDYSDHYGRLVQQMTCILIPFENIATSKCGFYQLAQAFSHYTTKSFLDQCLTMIRNGEVLSNYNPIPVSLPTSSANIDRIVASVLRYKNDDLIQCAGALSQKSLGLKWVDEGIPSWEDRLQWLDTILAFLPYGVRTDCPASSWATIGTNHKMRLYWANRVIDSHQQIYVSTSEISNIASFESEYATRLIRELNNRHVVDVLTQLSSLTDPLSFSNLHLQDISDRRFPNRINIPKPRKITTTRIVPDPTKSREDPPGRRKLDVPTSSVRTPTPIASEPNKIRRVTSETLSEDELAQITITEFFAIKEGFKKSNIYSNIWQVVNNGKGTSILEIIFNRVEKFSNNEKVAKQQLLILLIDYCLRMDYSNKFTEELFKFTNKFTEDYWLIWVHCVITQRANKNKMIQALKIFKNSRSHLIALIELIVGKRREFDISQSNINFVFLNKNIQYAIWLMRLDAICNPHKDSVFNSLGDWIISQYNKGYRMPQEDFRAMLKDRNITNRGWLWEKSHRQRAAMLKALEKIR